MQNSFYRKERKGFALIIAISLMAFIFLLLLSIGSLTQVDLAKSQSDTSVMVARKNAVLALSIALGELQMAAGPDQRVTARADIADKISSVEGSAGDQRIVFDQVNNPYLTLVYDVSGARRLQPGSEADVDFMPQHDTRKKPAVLISGNEGLGYDLTSGAAYPSGYITPDSTISPDSSRSALLVSAPAVSTRTPAVEVRAPYVNIESDGASLGRYAWWIGDEGIKARINFNYEALASAGNADSRWKTPHRLRGEAAFADFGSVSDDKFSSILNYQSIPLAASDWNRNLRAGDLLHDFSYDSASLLVDVRQGGFRKDLSYALGNIAGASALPDAQYLFPRSLSSASAAQDINTANAQWGVLRDFYTFAKDNAGAASIPLRYHRSASNYAADSSADQSANRNFNNGFFPVLSYLHFGFDAFLPAGINPLDDDEEVRLELHVMPSVVLWNPYDFDLECPELVLTVQAAGGKVGRPISLYFFYEDTDGSVKPYPISKEDDDWQLNQGKRTIVGPFSVTIEAITIPAGQAIVFSPASGATSGFYMGEDNGRNGKAYSGSGRNVLRPGYRSGASFKIDAIQYDRQGDEVGALMLPKQRRLKMFYQSGQGFDAVLGEEAAGEDFMGRRPMILMASNVQHAPIGSTPNQFFNATATTPVPRQLFVMYMPLSHDPLSLSNQFPVSVVGHLNPRAVVHSSAYPNPAASPEGYSNRVPTYVAGFFADADAQDQHDVMTQDAGGSGRTYIGNSSTAIDEIILYELPRTDMIALSQLSNANITGPTLNTFYNRVWKGAGDYMAPAYPIGSSVANPYILSLDAYTELLPGNNGASAGRPAQVWDFSYLLNSVLYDRYFFSTIPQSGNIDDELLSGERPLRNPLHRVRSGAGSTQLRNFDTAAENLDLVGGFNVNSTSINAWISLLSAFRGVAYDGNAESGSLLSRFDSPKADVIEDDKLEMDSAPVYKGYRRLSDPQISDLAERIVEQVKLRGPFPSVAAFVNRVIDTDALWREGAELNMAAPVPENMPSVRLSELVQLRGALQSALELSQINAPFYSEGRYIIDESDLTGASSAKKPFLGSLASGLPGFLSQIDIMNRLGSIITVRSDTFIIRTVGQSLSSGSGNVEATAYLEAIVQRVPDYVDSSNAADVGPLSPSITEINQTMGRRFEIVSVRWLRADEI